MTNPKKTILTITILVLCLNTFAQVSRLGQGLTYNTQANGQFGKGAHTPFWQSANRYGITSTDNNSGYFRARIQREVETDSLRKWRIGYGGDVVVPINFTSQFILQQLYADFQYKAVRLSVGQKERPLEMKNQALSSGSMVLGANARPIPQVRIEMPEFFVIRKTKNWIAIKGHMAYGCYTDNRWQRDFNAGANTIYTENSLYHSKAGYLRVGNTEKFPLTFTGGFEMVCQFGGTVYNLPIKDNNGHIETTHKQKAGLKEFFHAFIPTGSDINDGDNKNVMGNHLGSYQIRLDYHGKGWKASAYGEHYFEDHSQMGWDFDWKDFLWGAEITFPKNPVIGTVLYEHMRTTDQSGAVFKSQSTPNLPIAIGGLDDYYNHGIYGAYQHAGFSCGTPLILSPIYNGNNTIYCYDNRIIAHHVGLSTSPMRNLNLRVLYTYEKSYGTYKEPRISPTTSHFWMIELSYHPQKLSGISITTNYAQNHGNLTGNSKGALITISYEGKLRNTHKQTYKKNRIESP